MTPDPLAKYLVWWLVIAGPFLLVAAVFWGVMFLKLMAMRDDAFPGRHDKILWFAALLALNVFGALLFVVWRMMGTASSVPAGYPVRLYDNADHRKGGV